MTTKKAWISQFEAEDQPAATALLRALHLVSHDEFARVMGRMLRKHASFLSAPVALFVEREVKKTAGGRPCRLFKEDVSRKNGREVRRATGAAPPVIFSQRGDRSDVGSEGLLNSLTGQLARMKDLRCVTWPSPNLIRKKKIRHIFIVTDMIGSGDRVWNFLEAAWLVRSVRSWASRKFVTFTVFAYAATQAGQRRVARHPSRPEIITAIECPTISSEFGIDQIAEMESLCEKYYGGDKEPLGYGRVGALIIFKHGCPNNVPPILHEQFGKWSPLFPHRVGEPGFEELVPKFSGFNFGTVFEALGYPGVANSEPFKNLPLSSQKLTLLMCAVKTGVRSVEGLCSATSLPVSEIDDLLRVGVHQNLMSLRIRLTDLGIGTLHSVLGKNVATPLPTTEDTYYYPKQLRLPKESI